MQVKGFDATISFDGAFVRVGGIGFPVGQISTVEFQHAGWVTSGQIQFTVAGHEGYPTVLFNRR